jgi:hypothetical protein
MSQVNVTGISKSKVYPLNNQASYSPYRNNSVLNFEISPQSDKMIDPRTLRLNFELEVRKTADDAFPDGTLGGGEDVNLDSRIGINSIWDLVRIRQQTTNDVLEETRNYGHMASATMPSGTSLQNYKKHISNTYGAFGKDGTQASALSQALPCSLILRTGLCSSQSLWNLQALGGLRLELVMNSLSQVLYGGDADDYYFQITNPNITFNFVNLASPITSNQYQVAYPLYTSFSSVISSSNDQMSLAFSESQVRSVFSTTIKSSNLNNFATNAFTTNRLKDTAGDDQKVQELIFYKDSVKFPLDYIVTERDSVANSVYEALKNRLFMSCFQQFTRIANTLQSTTTQGTKTHRESLYGWDVADFRAYTGIGINYDMLRNASTVSFKNSMYAMRVGSQLTDATPNNVFCFTLSNRMLQTNPMGANQMN